MAVIEMIRPAVQLDGGDVELVEVTTDGVLRIRSHGVRIDCSSGCRWALIATSTGLLPAVMSGEQVT